MNTRTLPERCETPVQEPDRRRTRARVSTATSHQSTDLQRGALIAAGVDPRSVHDDTALSAKVGRDGLRLLQDRNDLLFIKPTSTLGPVPSVGTRLTHPWRHFGRGRVKIARTSKKSDPV